MMSVDESVFAVNAKWAREGARPIRGRICRKCGANNWHLRGGIDSQYRSEFNPGEYVEFTCAECGYREEEPS